MKRLTMLAMSVVTVLSLTGCSCGWPRWLSRGDNCNYCGGYGEAMYSTPTLMPPSYLAPGELPGPATITTPSTVTPVR
jgi:hypothetical protein